MSEKPIIYFIPGLAADKSIFRGIKLPGYETRCIEWVDPLPGEDISCYAKRFTGAIDQTQRFILFGVSLGGIMSIEMAQFCKPEKMILVSSIENNSEFPWYLKLFKWLPLYWVIPFPVFKFAMKQARHLAGHLQKNELLLISTMLDKASAKFFKWALHEILNWKQKGIDHSQLLHIHGTADKLLPYRFVKSCVPIKGGNHFMIVHKGKEISKIALDFLEGNQ
jgi:pimeloyl-ACP methyl ester carboxylesterase